MINYNTDGEITVQQAAFYLNEKDGNVVDDAMQHVCRKLAITVVDALQSGDEA